MLKPHQPGPGQESVWDYPRPPRLEPEPRPVRIVFNGATIAETSNALRILETSHPPNIYIPCGDIAEGVLLANPRHTVCEWKGTADYWNVQVADQTEPAAAWSYPRPSGRYAALADHVSFYPGRMEACYLGDELVSPQPGGFYGGWITTEIVGPFKGGTGTRGW